MTLKFADTSNLVKMQADLLVIPYHSLEYRKLQKAILQEEYRIDGFNNWVADVNRKMRKQ